ncbi:hypothetical protein BGZ61DRAFT_454828 [Ilyonectria robusta]|uniref:uncharacterized protein n=1 Tax=Ilyonectria robusta TaxID=1079257 RepID=UPI001E8E1D67|nr:uncharacterized protein BGZ61DRAFT_454828 [Ilyonectria robusta]KAH8684989.1 hypothetical protein BGZ61DRAFT_454828 [Ilyonectria robusta]
MIVSIWLLTAGPPRGLDGPEPWFSWQLTSFPIWWRLLSCQVEAAFACQPRPCQLSDLTVTPGQISTPPPAALGNLEPCQVG